MGNKVQVIFTVEYEEGEKHSGIGGDYSCCCYGSD